MSKRYNMVCIVSVVAKDEEEAQEIFNSIDSKGESPAVLAEIVKKHKVNMEVSGDDLEVED